LSNPPNFVTGVTPRNAHHERPRGHALPDLDPRHIREIQELSNVAMDYHEWKQLLKAAGLREARLHDARHAAAMVLLILGVPEGTVMGIMGWSSTGMTRGYQHVTDATRQTVATEVDGLPWGRGADGAREGDVGATDAN
jgi:integrase